MKKIAILGATGSVGTQALDVARARGYKVDIISANKSAADIERYAREFHPSFAVMNDEAAGRDLKHRLADTEVKVLFGEDGVEEAINCSCAETVVNAIIGEAGLKPTLAVLNAGRRLALANKESLVIAGEIVMELARKNGAEIIPVDSEHSAIFQSLKAGKPSQIKKIILTASGGPFYGMTREELRSVTLEDTLAHPTWKMGRKITVDSATLMNKGFEVIEAVHLFSVKPENVQVTVHRESILHSAVEYIDNTVIGEMSVPDMRMCVQYAIDYPERCVGKSAELDLFSVGSLSFARPDYEAFPLLSLASYAIKLGGAMPAVLNAADEVAVASFLEGKLSFVGISDVVGETFEIMKHAANEHGLSGIIAHDREARAIAKKIIKEKQG